MEEMGSKLEIELERLIGENPEVATENGHAGESVRMRLSSMAANSSNRTSLEKLHSNGNLEDGKVLMNNFQLSPTGQIRTGESNRTGDQSLTSALEKLSLGAERKGQTWGKLQNRPNLMEDQLQSYLNRPSLNTDTSMVAVPSLRSSNRLTNGYPDIHTTGLGPQNSLSLGPVSDGYKKWQVGHLQPFETPSAAMSFTHEVPDLNVPAPNLQFTLMSHHEQILPIGRSPAHYTHPQQMNHDQIGSDYTQEEPLHSYRMQGQYPYLHHVHNQQLEYTNPFQSCDSTRRVMPFQSPKQPYFEVPVSHHLEQSYHEAFWKGSAYSRCSNQSNPVFSTRSIDTFQGAEKSSRQSSPRNILARNYGQMNSLGNCVKVTSVDADESINYYIKRNGFVCPSCCARQNGLSSTTDCVCHKNLMLSAWFSNFTNRKTLPQKCNSLDEATGRIYLMAKDQHGCRFLQRKFVEGTPKDIEKIFSEIIDHVAELMTDPFGNYLIQKLLEVCDEDQRLQILYKITNRHGELIRISCDMHGTRAIQKVIETLKTPKQFSMIVSSLKNGIVILMKDVNGNHVAQHCLQYLVPDYIGFLFDAATKCCVEVATDRHGCCVLQKCVACSSVRQRENLICEVVRNALVLSQDQYGNYVVQFTLEHGLPWAISGILRRLEGHYVDLSMQKYSSNVVERCLYAGDEQLTKIVNELMNNARLSQIMQDPYGNYAIQAALARSEVCDSDLHARFVDAIRPHIPALRTNMYGRKVLAMLGKTN